MSDRHSKRHSSRYKLRKRKFIACLTVGCILIIGSIFFVIQDQAKQSSLQIHAGNSVNVKDTYRTRYKDGQEYRYNNQITAVLYAGLDSTDKMEASAQYSNKERADSITLVVLDKKKKKISLVPINRDTMTQVRRFALSGKDRGTFETHLGYAYSFGDGGKVSCENLLESVQYLFGEVPIHDYVVTNRTSIPYINRLVGGVTVTVPNDDLVELYPEFITGSQVTLDDGTVEDFVRYRDTGSVFSNEGRMQRQIAYIEAYFPKAQSQLVENPQGIWNGIQQMEDYLQTNITKNRYLELINLISGLEYQSENMKPLPGKDQEGELHDEFHVDQEELDNLILELFYEKV